MHVQNAQDQKRAKVWGTLAKKIIQAVKAGGADAAANQRLAEVLKQAKQAEVPRDIIDRNLKKATDKSQADFAEVGHTSFFFCFLIPVPVLQTLPRMMTVNW